jgi:predicted ArsR family transcriptional regulator
MGHPNRLPILIALEERPRTAKELVDDLGLRPDPVRFAIRQLRKADLVDVVGQRPIANNLVGLVYGTPRTGWSTILRAVEHVAASAPR